LEELYFDPPKVNIEFLKKAHKLRKGDFLPEYDSWFTHKDRPRISFDFSNLSPWRIPPKILLRDIADKYDLRLRVHDNFYELLQRNGKSMCEVYLYTIWIDPKLEYSSSLLAEIAFKAFGAKENRK
jgi:hypothetical protein